MCIETSSRGLSRTQRSLPGPPQGPEGPYPGPRYLFPGPPQEPPLSWAPLWVLNIFVSSSANKNTYLRS